MLNPFKYHKSIKRIQEAGVVKFFYDRKVLAEDVGPIGTFINQAKFDVTYVGCWLSTSLKQNLIDVVKEKALNGVVFRFCLHAPKTGAIQEYASFFNLDVVSVNTQLEDSILALNNLKESLPIEKRKNIQIYAHSEMITTSFWILDNAKDNAIIQLDFKLVHSTSRWFSFGFEVIRSESKLFDNIKKSYLSVIANSQIVDENFIEEIDGTRKRKSELKKSIIDKYPFNPKKPYIFISYSHKNDLLVLKDVLKIKSMVNCWIDFENLDGGRNRNENDWTMKVKPVLESNNCLGVISYVSEQGFRSKGYIKECDWIKVHRPEFYCFLINFEYNITPNSMLNKIRKFNVEGESETEKQIRDEALTYVTQATLKGKESYYAVDKNGQHLESTDFDNWIKKIAYSNNELFTKT